MREKIKHIQPVNEQMGQTVARYIDTLTKPQGSLGRVEELAIQLGKITGEPFPQMSHPGVIIMAADHGVAREGVSAFPQEVTSQMVYNFVQGGAAINSFAKQIGARLEIVDIGVLQDMEDESITHRKVRNGTGNIAQENAMTHEQAEQCIEIGMNIACKQIEQGVKCLIAGDMGIGNTTSSSAIIACCSQYSSLEDIATIVGIGTGINTKQLEHKQQIVHKALHFHQPHSDDPIDILAKIGGLEIGGMVGVMLGAAEQRKPIIVDGLISTAAALVAVKLCPHVRDYMIFAHLSQEPGHRQALELLQARPLLDLNLRLGEGSGAALAYPLVQAAANMLADMATFDSGRVSEKS